MTSFSYKSVAVSILSCFDENLNLKAGGVGLPLSEHRACAWQFPLLMTHGCEGDNAVQVNPSPT